MKIVVRAMLVLSLLMGGVAAAWAHTQSYGFLRAEIVNGRISGQLELAVRDLDLVYDLDTNSDGKVTWGELRQRETGLTSSVFRQISIGPAGAPCSLVPQPLSIDARGGENYAVFPFSGSCQPASGQIEVGYDLMFGTDAQHRGLIDLSLDGTGRSTVMTPETRVKTIDFQSASLFDVTGAFIAHGANHIWTGYDHMLFLCTLLLSSVLIRSKAEWRPVPALGNALWATARVVTAFTIAHSITLSAAVFNIVNLPSRVVECVIAASVAAAAINNLWPVVTRRIWAAAFVFGLMHGFGFASALTGLGLPPTRKLAALFSFNIGVEFGQLVVVALILPLLFCMRQTNVYSRLAMPIGSVAISIIGFLWFFQRATGMTIIFG